jgi:hypothetical protein
LLEVGATATRKQVASATFDARNNVTVVTFAAGHQPPAITFAPYRELENTTLAREKKPLDDTLLKTEILNHAWRAEDLGTIAGFQGWDTDELARSIYRYAQRELTPTTTVLSRFRQRASVFGHNAIDPKILPTGVPKPEDASSETLHTEGQKDKAVRLDAIYPGIVKDSWVVLSAGGEIDLQQIVQVDEVTHSRYFINARVTRLTLTADTNFAKFKIRETSVLAEQVALPIGTEPISPAIKDPNTSTPRKALRLDGVHLRLRPGRRVIVTGVRTDLPGQRGNEQRTLTEVRIEHGLTVITFDEPLTFDYDWTTVTVNANVARATHGESTKETLGSGNAAQPYQRFALRQKPLTWTGAETASGSESSLQVFVNDVRWSEAEMLYGRSPDERIYTTRRSDDGTTVVQFGDGITGARVPTGVENVRAEYRKGIGLEGLVRADQLSILLTRPLGAKGVTNPLPAVDAADPEPRDEARKNAPLQVLTLGRAVSLRDYEDFARSFAGVAKSHATRVSGRDKPGIFVTVAAANGAAFTRTNDLATALRNFGDPFVPLYVKTFASVLFRVEAEVKIAPDRIPAVVQKAIEAALRERYSFDSRRFGQPVFRSEVIAVIQSVEGVLSTLVTLRDDKAVEVDRIAAIVPAGKVNDNTPGAQLLSLDPRPVQLVVTT